jgi:hypothetical protein
LFNIEIIWTGQEKFHTVITGLFCQSEALGQGLVEHERTGSGFGDEA